MDFKDFCVSLVEFDYCRAYWTFSILRISDSAMFCCGKDPEGFFLILFFREVW